MIQIIPPLQASIMHICAITGMSYFYFVLPKSLKILNNIFPLHGEACHHMKDLCELGIPYPNKIKCGAHKICGILMHFLISLMLSKTKTSKRCNIVDSHNGPNSFL